MLEEKNMNFQKKYKNCNWQIVINFWMIRFEPYFQKSLFQSFFVELMFLFLSFMSKKLLIVFYSFELFCLITT
jgi:hypothetical protein